MLMERRHEALIWCRVGSHEDARTDSVRECFSEPGVVVIKPQCGLKDLRMPHVNQRKCPGQARQHTQPVLFGCGLVVHVTPHGEQARYKKIPGEIDGTTDSVPIEPGEFGGHEAELPGDRLEQIRVKIPRNNPQRFDRSSKISLT